MYVCGVSPCDVLHMCACVYVCGLYAHSRNEHRASGELTANADNCHKLAHNVDDNTRVRFSFSCRHPVLFFFVFCFVLVEETNMDVQHCFFTKAVWQE